MLRVELLDSTIECIVDSGFAGGILVPFSTFESLGFLSNMSKEEFSAVRPDMRSFPLFTSRGRAKIGPMEIDVDVHSSPALSRSLVGRQFLKNLRAELDGPRRTLTIRNP